MVKWIINESKRLLVKGGNIALCCSGGGGPGTIEYANWSIWMDEVLDFKNMIIWDKGRMGIGWQYRRSYEVILIATKPGEKCKWYDETDRIENVIRPGYYGIRKIIPDEDSHPTPKPVALMAHFIKLHTQPGDLVVDPCMGSGPTAEACRLMDRRFIGIEIDPYWCKKSVRRVKLLSQRGGWNMEYKK